MKVYAKSALREELMKRKLELGADALEVQLIKEKLEPVPGMPVKVVHSILHPTCVDLDRCTEDPWTTLQMEEAYRVAEFYGAAMLVHCGTNFDSIPKRTLIDIVHVLELHKDTELLVENVIPFREFEPQVSMRVGNFNPDATPEIVRQLRKLTGRDNIHSVLDTCHAEMTIKFIESALAPGRRPSVTLEDYFKAHEDTIGLYHFSQIVGDGLGKSHAQPFWDGEHDNQTMRWYLELYKKYGHEAPITLEVAETDYAVSNGFGSSYKILRRQERLVYKDGSVL